MKKIFLILLTSAIFVHISHSQTLIQQIDSVYNTLDSVSYIKDIILSYRGDLVIRHKVYEEKADLLTELNHLDSIQRQKQIIDSLWENLTIRSKTLIEERINEFSNRIRAKTPVYVLNLIPQDKQTLRVDSGRFAFNLFYFDNDYKGSLYIYCKDGQYSWQDARYRTSSQQLGKNAPKVFRKIMKKRPDYILFCSAMEGMNTILYVMNDKIYVCRIIQMQEYELSDYINKFGIV